MMTYMILQIKLANNGYIELTGDSAKYWPTEGLPTYEGLIAGLPDVVFEELLERKLIKSTVCEDKSLDWQV